MVESRTGLRWLWPLLLLISTLSATGALSLYGQVQAAEMDEFAALPANLVDVLHVKCR
jgi:hypothetical protein